SFNGAGEGDEMTTPTYTLIQSTLTVSGHPPLPAISVLLPDGSVMATASCSEALAPFVARTKTELWKAALLVNVRCQGCSRWYRKGELGGRELGLSDVLCLSCRTAFVASCLTANGRLPNPDEFWCRGCNGVLPLTQRVKPDGGRTRLRCVTCRRQQVQAAGRRQQERRRAAAG